MISKTHTDAQKLHGRQLNAKVCGSKSAIFRILSFFFVQQQYFKIGLSTHHGFSTKLSHISGGRSMNIQRLHNFN